MKTKQDLINSFLFEQQGQFHAPHAELLSKFYDYAFGWVSVEERLPDTRRDVEIKFDLAASHLSNESKGITDKDSFNVDEKIFLIEQQAGVTVTHWREIIE